MKRIQLQSRKNARRNHLGPDVPENHEQDSEHLGTGNSEQESETLERPTTFQLAQLAATLATRPDSVKISPADVVLEAMQLWEAAMKVNLSERQEREIWCALFEDSREEWEKRLSGYVGDKFSLYDLLAQPRLIVETEVLPHLFPEDNEESRKDKFGELVHYAQEHDFFIAAPNVWHPEMQGVEQHEDARQLQETMDGEDLLGRKINAFAVRMLVEAQQQKEKHVAV